jgi:peptidoglycan/xylan/chitin deacetylase (PgdA/CDA1 family)
VPVLMYHSVSSGRRGERYAVSPRRFARQMSVLRWTRRRVEPLDDLVADWATGRPPARGAVALTFDDGYRDALTEAWPVLRRRGWPATLFIVAGRAGCINTWDAGSQPVRPLLTWDEVRTLDRAGFRAHSHSCSHADLGAAEDGLVAEEVQGSLERVEAELSHRARLFAYPFGRHGSAARAAVERAGYDAAFSTRAGLNTPVSDRWARPRVEIRGTDGLLRFALKVWVGEDPLRTLPPWLPGRIRGAR